MKGSLARGFIGTRHTRGEFNTYSTAQVNVNVDLGGLVLDQLWNRQGLSGSTHPPFEGGVSSSAQTSIGGGICSWTGRE